jgi:hypothetical protein
MRRVGDRRANVRLEVVGDLWGTLETRKCAQVVDLNDTGALLRSPIALSPNSVHAVEVTEDGHSLSTEVRVCHVRSGPAGSFLVGVQFLSVPAGSQREF